MKDIFEFNHTDKSLSESDVKTLKDFYSHYHKKYWCFKRSYRSINFLMMFLQYLEYAWCQYELSLVE